MSHLNTAYMLGANAALQNFNETLDKLAASAAGGRIALPGDPGINPKTGLPYSVFQTHPKATLTQQPTLASGSNFEGAPRISTNFYGSTSGIQTPQALGPGAYEAALAQRKPTVQPTAQPTTTPDRWANLGEMGTGERLLRPEGPMQPAAKPAVAAAKPKAKPTATAKAPASFNMEAEANQPLAGLGGGAYRPSAKPATPRARPRSQTSYADLADEGYTPRNAGEAKARQQFMAELAPKPKASPAVASVMGGVGRAGGVAQSVKPSAVATKEVPAPRIGSSRGGDLNALTGWDQQQAAVPAKGKMNLDSLLPPGSKL